MTERRAALEEEIRRLEAHAAAQGLVIVPPEDDDGTWEPSLDAEVVIQAIAERYAALQYEDREAEREKRHALERAVFPEQHPPAWDATTTYEPGAQVWHDGREWTALSDVETGSAPDDIYDEDAETGGWRPA